MDGIGGFRKRRHFRCDHVSCCFFVAILWMAATAAPTAAAVAVEGDDDAAAAAAAEWPAIKKPTTAQIGHWGSLLHPRGTVSPQMSATRRTTEVWATHSPSHLPPCNPHRVFPHGWIGMHNTYIDVTYGGCSLMVGDPTAIAEETDHEPSFGPHLLMLQVYDGRHPSPTRHQLRAAKRRSCTASVSRLLPPLHNGSVHEPSLSQLLQPPPEIHSTQLMDGSGRGGHRRRLNRTRLGVGGRILVRSYRVRKSSQPPFHVWTSAAVRIDLHGACEPVAHVAGARGSLRLSVNYHPQSLSICEERHEASMKLHPHPTGVLFAHERRFGSLLPERLRCRGRLDYAAYVRAQNVIVSSIPDPTSCRRLCVADRCGAQLRGMRLESESEDGEWLHVRYESTTRSGEAHHATGTGGSAATDQSPEEDSEEDDDDRHHDSGIEDPDSDDDVDAIGNAPHVAASRCRTDVYSGFVLVLSPSGHAYLLP